MMTQITLQCTHWSILCIDQLNLLSLLLITHKARKRIVSYTTTNEFILSHQPHRKRSIQPITFIQKKNVKCEIFCIIEAYDPIVHPLRSVQMYLSQLTSSPSVINTYPSDIKINQHMYHIAMKQNVTLMTLNMINRSVKPLYKSDQKCVCWGIEALHCQQVNQ